jgi:thiol:disulfide interchange protein DsbD
MTSKLGLLTILAGLMVQAATADRAWAQRADPASVSAELSHTVVHAGQDAVVAVVLDVKRGFHAQSHTPNAPNLIALTVKPEANPSATMGEPTYPPGHDETYADLGVLNVYGGRTVFYVPVKIAADAKEGPLKLVGTIRYQVCDDKTCFPPKNAPWSVETKVVAKENPPPVNAPELFKHHNPAPTAPTTRPAARGGAPAGNAGGDGGGGGAIEPPAVLTASRPEW